MHPHYIGNQEQKNIGHKNKYRNINLSSILKVFDNQTTLHAKINYNICAHTDICIYIWKYFRTKFKDHSVQIENFEGING